MEMAEVFKELVELGVISKDAILEGVNGDRLKLSDGTTWMYVPEESLVDYLKDFASTYSEELDEKLVDALDYVEDVHELVRKIYENNDIVLEYIITGTKVVMLKNDDMVIQMDELGGSI